MHPGVSRNTCHRFLLMFRVVGLSGDVHMAEEESCMKMHGGGPDVQQHIRLKLRALQSPLAISHPFQSQKCAIRRNRHDQKPRSAGECLVGGTEIDDFLQLQSSARPKPNTLDCRTSSSRSGSMGSICIQNQALMLMPTAVACCSCVFESQRNLLTHEGISSGWECQLKLKKG